LAIRARTCWSATAEAGSALLRTDTAGAIEMRFSAGALRVETQRDRARRYWHEG